MQATTHFLPFLTFESWERHESALVSFIQVHCKPTDSSYIKGKNATMDGANHHGEQDTCLYNILLDIRGITGIVDLSVVLKGDDTKWSQRTKAKSKIRTTFSEGCTTKQVTYGSGVLETC